MYCKVNQGFGIYYSLSTFLFLVIMGGGRNAFEEYRKKLTQILEGTNK